MQNWIVGLLAVLMTCRKTTCKIELSYCSRHAATDGGLVARLEPRDGRSAAPRARNGL